MGRNNLVCDFVENFLIKHHIPCGYLSGRRLSSFPATLLADGILQMLFDSQIGSFAEAIERINKYCANANKPFVLIIDGLNEHHKINDFSIQLEHFIESIIPYPHIKLLLTCRSEFFSQRFGNLLSSSFSGLMYHSEVNEVVHDRKEFSEEMLSGYFRFFRVNPKLVSQQVFETLKKDVLLLRFFCEAYGARGKPADYKQTWIGTIYRDQIFSMYLERKIGGASAFFERIADKVSPRESGSEMREVLSYCIDHMLTSWEFSNVPISVVPSRLHTALYALLDEELILRRDAPPGPSFFSPSDETINFTFDEFRDYLLAEFLLYSVYKKDAQQFEAVISRAGAKEWQASEGVRKFLFYASRKPGNSEFLNFYRNHSWYADSYDVEIFNIDAAHLLEADRDLVLEGLRGGGEKARHFSRSLAVRWQSEHFPILNLELAMPRQPLGFGAVDCAEHTLKQRASQA